ncbi:MAG TPA: hypothetical protein VKC59_01870, partial [Candidatus Limnocylindrales bacterium]|nr:hypothetical protein [Candidatus Limnocylindrales bacterium]
MSRSSGWSAKLAVLVAGAAIIVSACTGAASTAPSAGPTATPGVTAAPYAGESYPATAVDCAKPPA